MQARHIISTNEDWYKSPHQVLEKGGTYFIGEIFSAFDELYLLRISVFNTTRNVMHFPS